MKRKTIQGPALVANVEGLVKTAGLPRAKQKSTVTGFNKGVFLDPSDLAAFNGGQVEVANCNSYLVGNIRSITAEKSQLNIKMSERISGGGHPLSFGEVSSGGEFLAELSDYQFAYIGPGEKGGNRLFIQSAHHGHCGFWSITLFPPDGKLLNPFTIDHLQTMRSRGGWGSVTVLPPKDVERHSTWWRPRRPLMREFAESFSD